MRTLPIGAVVAATALAAALLPAQPAAATAPPTSTVGVASGAVAGADATDDTRAGARLSVSTRRFVGGQALTWRGSLGVPGSRRIVLQQNMNRPGDTWTRVLGFRGRTRADGSFRFRFPGPSMMNISYRVFAKGHPSPRVTLAAKSQDSVLWVAGRNRLDPERPAVPVVGRPFTISVDTTPANLFARPDTQGLPVFAGRVVTLQKRDRDMTWTSLRRTRVLAGGMAFFPGVVAPAGGRVYRVRQEAWTRHGSQVGWHPSFPTYVKVARNRAAATRLTAQARAAATRLAAQARTADAVRGPGSEIQPRATASQKYRWTPSVYDFAWERGESLTSKPYRGTRKRGRWIDYADGTGRAAKLNGGLSLDSKRHNGPGPGDRGTVRATLRGNALTYGRWETSLRLKLFENRSPDYKVRVELVPENPARYDCGRHNVLVAEVAANSRTMRFGVKAGGRQWRGAHPVGNMATAVPAVAVEVQRGHISWLLDGRPVGTVKDRRAVSDLPMTMRISMVAAGRREMDKTTVMSDWQRAFPASTGQQVRSGAPLRRSSLPGSCRG